MNLEPVSIFALAEHLLRYTPKTGADFEKVGLPIMGGCQRCGASLAAYNAYPSKTGYLFCRQCLTPALAWIDVELCAIETAEGKP